MTKSFYPKVAGLSPVTLLKKKTPPRIFPREFMSEHPQKPGSALHLLKKHITPTTSTAKNLLTLQIFWQKMLLV